jgi:hypothetical protein
MRSAAGSVAATQARTKLAAIKGHCRAQHFTEGPFETIEFELRIVGNNTHWSTKLPGDVS